MKTYQEFEKSIYDWLMTKHEADPSFTFSLRQKANKGSERDYFIGTKNYNYFGTTFWYIPVSYPGSSSDVINLMFRLNEDGYTYYFQFVQTKTRTTSKIKLVLKW